MICSEPSHHLSLDEQREEQRKLVRYSEHVEAMKANTKPWLKEDVNAEISRIRWALSASKQADSALLSHEVLLFALGQFRVVRCGRAIQFALGTWLLLRVGSGECKTSKKEVPATP